MSEVPLYRFSWSREGGGGAERVAADEAEGSYLKLSDG